MKKETLLEARNIIEDIYINGLSENSIMYLYNLLGNKSIPLIFRNSASTASFSAKYMYVSVNSEKLNKWLDKMISDSLKYFDVSDIELLKSYLALYVIYHEIEHSNQKLISEGIKEPSYEYECKVYHDIIDVIVIKRYLLLRPISLTRYVIYRNNEYDFILERNASIEGYNIASSVANISNDKEIQECLISIRNAFMLQGYIDEKEGCLKNTYKRLGMMRKYNNLVFPNDISLEERVRKGLELTEEERKKVILSLKHSTQFQ